MATYFPEISSDGGLNEAWTAGFNEGDARRLPDVPRDAHGVPPGSQMVKGRAGIKALLAASGPAADLRG
jgi:hypothetical protein